MLTAEKVVEFRESWRPTPEKVDLAVKTAVEIAKPSRVFIFGSWARGEANIDSDLDLAVLVPDERRNEIGELRKAILRAFGSIPMSIDSINSIYYKILRKGELVYDARNQEAGAGITDQSR
jgi:predicted nucleotidyltransferase